MNPKMIGIIAGVIIIIIIVIVIVSDKSGGESGGESGGVPSSSAGESKCSIDNYIYKMNNGKTVEEITEYNKECDCKLTEILTNSTMNELGSFMDKLMTVNNKHGVNLALIPPCCCTKILLEENVPSIGPERFSKNKCTIDPICMMRNKFKGKKALEKCCK